MRSCNHAISFTTAFPFGKPDQNGVIYTREAVENALHSMPDNLPIIDLRNDGEERVIGVTTCSPYAIQLDEEHGVFRFTIDGRIFFGGTSCIVNTMNDAGEITDFSITKIGVSE